MKRLTTLTCAALVGLLCIAGCASAGRVGGNREPRRVSSAELMRGIDERDRMIAKLSLQLEDTVLLRAENEKLRSEIDQLKAGKPLDVTAPGPEHEEAIRKAVDESEVRRAAERAEARKQQIESLIAATVDHALGVLEGKLTLTAEQRVQVKDALLGYQNDKHELGQRMSEARKAGEETDSLPELTALIEKYTKLVRELLDETQKTAFDEFVGDRGLEADALSPSMSRRAGRNAGRQGR